MFSCSISSFSSCRIRLVGDYGQLLSGLERASPTSVITSKFWRCLRWLFRSWFESISLTGLSSFFSGLANNYLFTGLRFSFCICFLFGLFIGDLTGDLTFFTGDVLCCYTAERSSSILRKKPCSTCVLCCSVVALAIMSGNSLFIEERYSSKLVIEFYIFSTFIASGTCVSLNWKSVSSSEEICFDGLLNYCWLRLILLRIRDMT